MNPSRTLALLLALAGSAVAGTIDPLHYIRIDLLDGRTLQDVVVRSYDPASGKLLIETNGRVQLIPLSLLPPPVAARLKSAAPEGAGNTSVVAVPPATKDDTVSVKLPTEPAPANPAAPAPADPYSPASEEKRIALHLKAAEARATNYYQFQFQRGSGYISVTVLNFDTDDPVPVDGWTGRYRTEGKAYLEFYDSKGHSFQRTTERFEVVTEQKTPTSRPKAIEFTSKLGSG